MNEHIYFPNLHEKNKIDFAADLSLQLFASAKPDHNVLQQRQFRFFDLLLAGKGNGPQALYSCSDEACLVRIQSRLRNRLLTIFKRDTQTDNLALQIRRLPRELMKVLDGAVGRRVHHFDSVVSWACFDWFHLDVDS